MAVVAYSDRLHPADHPLLACAGMVFPFFLIANLLILVAWLIFKWRRAWIPLAGFIVTLPAIRIYIPLHFHHDPPAGSIKVISYNVAGYGYDKEKHNQQDSILAYLKRQGADIVCLQEDSYKQRDSVADFPDVFEYNDTVHVIPMTPKQSNSVGIHTRYPVVDKELLHIESKGNGAVAFYLKIDNDTVIVINCHLESTHLTENDKTQYGNMITGNLNTEDTKAETRMLLGKLSTAMATRARQADVVHDYIEHHRRYPIIVCGDFNDTPISYVRRTVARGLTDCYVESGSGLGVSYYPRGFYFRIDHMMCSEHFEPYNCHIDKSIKSSDHYPVICWLKRVK